MSISQPHVEQLATFDPAQTAIERFADTGSSDDLELSLVGVIPGTRTPIDRAPRTNWGRRVVAGAVLSIFVLGAAHRIDSTLDNDRSFHTGPVGTEQPTPTTTTPSASCESVTAQPGDTVWRLVGDTNPSGDIREVVDTVIERDLDGHQLQVGDTITPCK